MSASEQIIDPLSDGVASPGNDFSVYEAFQPTIDAAVPFSSVNDLFEAIDAIPRDDDAYRTSQVTPSQLTAVLRERERRGRKFCLWYVENVRLLIVTIPSGRHGSTSRYLCIEVARQLMDMSLAYELVPRGSETHSGREPGGVSGQGEGDESWVPRSTRPGPDPWPTLVIEVGFTQTVLEMRAKAQLWFRLSNFDVKIVLLVKLSSTQRSMTIEKWKALSRDPRPGPQTRAVTATLEPQCVKVITVLAPGWAQVMNPQAFAVVSTGVRLEFIDLFLRQPGPDEHDIVISTNCLQHIASVIFFTVTPIPSGESRGDARGFFFPKSSRHTNISPRRLALGWEKGRAGFYVYAEESDPVGVSLKQLAF